MKIIFYAEPTSPYDRALYKAFKSGVRKSGQDGIEACSVNLFDKPEEDVDLAIIVGPRPEGRYCWQMYRKAGRHTLILDKGHIRLVGGLAGVLYWRASLNHFQPTDYFQKFPRPADRWNKLGVEIQPWQGSRGNVVIFAGSSVNYCNWHKLPSPVEYARDTLNRFCKLEGSNSFEFMYRPKPSDPTPPVDGFMYSPPKRKLIAELAKAYCLVTYGSNAAVEAILAGIPAMVLGDNIARPLARTRLENLKNLFVPSDEQRQQWAYDLAYCQWTLDEFASGEAWQSLRELVLLAEQDDPACQEATAFRAELRSPVYAREASKQDRLRIK